MSPRRFTMLMLVALMATACDEGAEPPTSTVAADASPGTQNPALTPWSPNATTSAVPTYGKSCRFAADIVVESPSNGMPDDRLTLVADSSGADLTFAVLDGTTTAISATIRLERALADKSWRNGTGSATWTGGQTVSVVDAAVCFPERLTAGVAATGELTLVVESEPGVYESASGSFTVDGSDVLTSSGETVDSVTLDIDLR